MAAPPRNEDAPAGNRGASDEPAGELIQNNDTAGNDVRQGGLGQGLQDWARRRVARLADEFVHDGIADSAVAFFNTTCQRERLLEALRDAAEPAFHARLAELASAAAEPGDTA